MRTRPCCGTRRRCTRGAAARTAARRSPDHLMLRPGQLVGVLPAAPLTRRPAAPPRLQAAAGQGAVRELPDSQGAVQRAAHPVDVDLGCAGIQRERGRARDRRAAGVALTERARARLAATRASTRCRSAGRWPGPAAARTRTRPCGGRCRGGRRARSRRTGARRSPDHLMLRQPGPLACRARMPRPVAARVAALDRVVALLQVRLAAAPGARRVVSS